MTKRDQHVHSCYGVFAFFALACTSACTGVMFMRYLSWNTSFLKTSRSFVIATLGDTHGHQAVRKDIPIEFAINPFTDEFVAELMQEELPLASIKIPLNHGITEELIEQVLRTLDRNNASINQSRASQGEIVLDDAVRCRRSSMPPSVVPEAYDGKATVCAIQDPYERMVNLFRRGFVPPRNRKPNLKECFFGLNSIVNETLQTLLHIKRKVSHFHCELLPQAAYVYGWDHKKGVVDKTKRRCLYVVSNVTSEALPRFAAKGFSWTSSSKQNCPMLNRRSFSQPVRDIIEKVFKEDFSLLKFTHPISPEFIHIPRTGGTTVEDHGMGRSTGGVRIELWGHMHPKILHQPPMRLGRGAPCYRQHVPPSQLPEVYKGRETFCVVRDVYSRLVSQYKYEMQMWQRLPCSQTALNSWIATIPMRYPYGSDCHFLDQGAYIYSWNPETAKVDKRKKWCKHVFQFERLQNDLNEFFATFDYPMRVDDKAAWTASSKRCSLRSANLSSSSKQLIARFYADDIRLLKEIDENRTSRRQTLRNAQGTAGAASLDKNNGPHRSAQA